MKVYDYVTQASTETVHLMPQERWADAQAVTLCGLPAAGMTGGDETLSGIAATCGRCTRLLASRTAGR